MLPSMELQPSAHPWTAVCLGLDAELRQLEELRRDLLAARARGVDHLTAALLDETWLARLLEAHADAAVLRRVLERMRESLAAGEPYDVDALRAAARDELGRRPLHEHLAALVASLPVPPAPRMIRLFDCHVAGTTFRSLDRVLRADGSIAVEAAEAELAVGDVLRLEREPMNRWDPRAIRVLTPNDRWLGYVPRAKSETAARLLDAGKRVGAVLDATHRHAHGWLELRIGVCLIDVGASDGFKLDRQAPTEVVGLTDGALTPGGGGGWRSSSA